MNKKIHLLLAEDDPNLGFVVQDHLNMTGYEVTLASNGQEALQAFRRQSFALAIVDVMMPRMDGFTLVEQIRSVNEDIPILMLTARSMEEDRIRGFECGADDYITKPFSMTELTYRVKVFLRRRPEEKQRGVLFSLGRLVFDPANLEITGGEESITLTQMEANLLQMLAEYRNQLVKREDILIHIWGENDYFKGRSLDVFISRLRKYLKDDPSLQIKNHHGVGFTLVDGHFAG